MRNQLSQRDDFYPQIVKLVIPIIIQNLLSAAVNSADVIMLNFVGQSSISAVSLAANYSNVLFMVYYGLGTGATLLCAQYYGKGDYKAIQIIEGIALRFSMIISVLVALVAFTMPQMMMRLFTNDPELLAIGSSYIRIMGITYICWGMTEVYLAVLRSIGRVTTSMAMNMLAFGLNRIVRSTQAWCYRCGYCYCTFQNDRADRLFYCFCFQQKCPTGSPMYVHKKQTAVQ